MWKRYDYYFESICRSFLPKRTYESIHHSEHYWGLRELYFREKKTYVLFFPKICGLDPNLKIILPDLCVVSINDKLFKVLCGCFCAI